MSQESQESTADFRMFVQKIGLQGFYALGLIEAPGLPRLEKPNLEAARAVIEDLRMLRDKTRGNLSEGERMTLDKFLGDLQLQFVQCKAEASGESGPAAADGHQDASGAEAASGEGGEAAGAPSGETG